MDTVIQTTGWPRATTLYRYSIIICGAAALVSAPRWLSIPHFDLRFLFLVAVTILVSSRFAVQIPRVNTNVTVSDTFIFLVLLLYGGFAGIVLAAAEGLFSGLRISKTPVMIAFNSAMMACSTFLTVVVLRVFFGSVADLRTFELSSFIAAVGTMAMVQYFANTGFTAVGLALKTGESVWLTWQKHYLWTSITYIAGAAVAAATVNSFAKAGFTIFIVGAPVIAIIYFTYHKYLDEIKSTSAQAEQAERQRAEAERARAEAERERAEQAERHVEELNRHIAEQERISSQLKESKEHFRHAAFHDTLTNLPNRALLAENLKFVIERAKQHEDYQFAVLFLDLDRFKNVNDSLGHSIGDQLLIAMARRLESCNKGMHTHAVYLLQMENDLRRAIDREELRVHYQPIVSLDSGQLAGFEALVRWQHPERGFINPSDFIPLAEDTGLIVPLGIWVLRRACEQLGQWQWQSAANRSLFMSVNLSGKQVARPKLVSEIRQVLEETRIEPKYLKLEITESAVMENAETAVQLLRRLKALGVQLSIDDFGTGYSSLGYLHRFPVNTLKIDRSFVGRIGEAAENIEIVRTIVSLAENMGMEVVAEGVETLSQLSQLRKLSCQYGQGYLFSRPVDAGSVTAWISRKPHWQADLFPTLMNEQYMPAKPAAPVIQLVGASA